MRRARLIATIVALACGVAAAQFTPPPRAAVGWINAGDPRAVPVIVSRLREAAGRPLSQPIERSLWANLFREAGRYQLDEFGPMLAAFARRGDLSEADLAIVAEAAAEYRSPAAETLQRSLLTDPRMGQTECRVKLLARLADNGDDRAADALATWTAGELRRIEGEGPEGEASNALWMDVPRVRSPRLLASLRAMPQFDSDFGRTLQGDLLRRLTANQESPSALLERARSAPTDDVFMRTDAVAVLGRIGTSADLAGLMALPDGEWASTRHNERLDSWRDGAIASIRRRFWRELAATTRPEGER